MLISVKFGEKEEINFSVSFCIGDIITLTSYGDRVVSQEMVYRKCFSNTTQPLKPCSLNTIHWDECNKLYHKLEWKILDVWVDKMDVLKKRCIRSLLVKLVNRNKEEMIVCFDCPSVDDSFKFVRRAKKQIKKYTINF